MATNDMNATSKQIKQDDFVQFINIFASEFNNDTLHDRVLIFEIIDNEPRIEQSEEKSEPKPKEESSEAGSYEYI